MNKQQWEERVAALKKILSGLEANPPKREYGERWKPGCGEKYWIVDTDGEADRFTWRSDDFDGDAFNSFNVFETKEEAEFARERTKVMRELDLWAMDNTINRKNKRYIYYDSNCNRILIAPVISHTRTSHVFESEEIAQKAINAIGEERLKKYYFKVVD